MNSKLLGALAAVALLAACADKKDTGASTGAGAATSGPVPGSQEDLVANVGDRVFFDFNLSTLKTDARSTLDRQSGWLSKYPQVNVQVSGNCDDRGTERSNLALGQRRANSSRDYLVARGVAGSRVSTISYGKIVRRHSEITSSPGRRTATRSPRSADPSRFHPAAR
jgi:peptidoglycan-associated lipoprotein